MRIRSLLAALAVAGSLVAASPAPAHAATEVCAGTGVLRTPPMHYTIHNAGPINGVVGVCTSGFAAVLAGNIEGTCARYSGNVVVNGHHFGAFVGVGSTIVFSGSNLTGNGQMVPAPGKSCLVGADDWQLKVQLALA